MAAQRVAMRNVKECLRLKLEADLSHEKIARTLQLPKGAVSKCVTAARDTGLEWPALAVLEETALLQPTTQCKRRGERVLDKRLIASLAGGEWTRQQHNLLLGPSVVGKTWLA